MQKQCTFRWWCNSVLPWRSPVSQHIIYNTSMTEVNSLVPGKSDGNFKKYNFQAHYTDSSFGTHYEIAFSRMPQNLTALVQVMAWCQHASKHCLSQCWFRSMFPYIEHNLKSQKCTPCLNLNSLRPSDAIWWQDIWVNIGSGNGLLPDGTKPLPEPMLTYHQWGLVAFIWG